MTSPTPAPPLALRALDGGAAGPSRRARHLPSWQGDVAGEPTAAGPARASTPAAGTGQAPTAGAPTPPPRGDAASPAATRPRSPAPAISAGASPDRPGAAAPSADAARAATPGAPAAQELGSPSAAAPAASTTPAVRPPLTQTQPATDANLRRRTDHVVVSPDLIPAAGRAPTATTAPVDRAGQPVRTVPTTANPTTAIPTTAGPTTAGPTTATPTAATPTTTGPVTTGPAPAARNASRDRADHAASAPWDRAAPRGDRADATLAAPAAWAPGATTGPVGDAHRLTPRAADLRPAPPTVPPVRPAEQGWADRDAERDADRGTALHGGTHAAHRFESVLRRAPAAPAPLPVQWRPLASAIAGERRVRVSTNAASRAALRAAGKHAATTGDTIHLARPLRGPADAPLLAHELTHVAAPSPRPRFFDDERDTPEERRAEMIADVIRRSPVLPRPHTGAGMPALSRPAPGASRTPSVARSRAGTAATGTATTGTATTATGAGSISADELARRLAGTSSGSTPGAAIRRSVAPDAPIQRRWTAGSRSGQGSRRGGLVIGDVRTEVVDDDNGGDVADQSAPSTTSGAGGAAAESGTQGTRSWPAMTGGLDSSSLRDLADWILEQVEARITSELERRGGRYRGEF